MKKVPFVDVRDVGTSRRQRNGAKEYGDDDSDAPAEKKDTAPRGRRYSVRQRLPSFSRNRSAASGPNVPAA
jgi:hypothetical protein